MTAARERLRSYEKKVQPVYLPVEQLGALIGQAHYCGACFTGLYPTPVHLVQPVVLARSDKGTADILVLDEADTVGNAGRMAVAQRGIQPSESCALAAVGAEFVRDLEPGEILVFSRDGIVSRPDAWL